jgi:serine/threonine-protein kinase
MAESLERIEALRREGKITEAAGLAAGAGDHRLASVLLEEACDFAGAAREALLAGEPKRAILFAAIGGSDALAEQAIGVVAESSSRDEAIRAASDLAARGHGREAGALFARVGEHLEAAHAFAAANEALRAAECYEKAGRPADGARALEASLRLRPSDRKLRLELARLLARHGRSEAAVKTLQQLDIGSEERAASLPLLARLLAELGLEEAARNVKNEMARLGVSADEPVPPSIRTQHANTPGAGALLFGRYELVREVAATPHARVVEAVDRITSERVAVKILASSIEGTGRDAFLRFEREAKALAQLRHPHVVPLRAYIPEGPALVVAWMSGGSLAEWLSRELVAPARAVEIACAILGALGEAHRLGILHRDVKPSNVLFDEIGAPRLSDFGAAHLGDLSSTATAGAIGTFAYMSPEQRLGRPASVASDIYGVGALLLELLSGIEPEPAHVGELAHPPSARNPDLKASHDAVVARLLEEDPARRPADAFEARRALEALSWPARLPPSALQKAQPKRPTDRPPASVRSRLASPRDLGDGRDVVARRYDAWLDRDVLVHPLDDASLAIARAFARAGHPALPCVLRIDREKQEIWIAPPRGKALADEPRAVSPGQLARLKEAVALLHEAGGVHGCIDVNHVYVHDGEVVLAYPRSASQGADPARDQAAVESLA